MTLLNIVSKQTALKNNMKFNNENKPVFVITPIEQFKRFLVLGTENGTYYVSNVDLTKQSTVCINELLDSENRELLLTTILEFEELNKCKKKDPMIYTLALCCMYCTQKKEFLDFRRKAYTVALKVCKIPTHLFLFINFCKVLSKYNSGWNNLHKRYISSWYLDKTPEDLMYLVTKYNSRNNYTHRDVLRLSHPKTTNVDLNNVFKYLTNKLEDNSVFEYINDYEQLKSTTNTEKAIELIEKRNFVREHVPTELLNNTKIWKALLKKMPLLAMLRNLNKMTLVNLFEDSSVLEHVIKTISNKDLRKKAKIHPMHILITLKMYSSGNSRQLSWTPNQKIVDCLDKTFYEMFADLTPTNKRLLLCLDVSGSMTYGGCFGTECIKPIEVETALSMIFLATEKQVDVMGFSGNFIPLNISPRRRLDDNLRSINNLPFNSTDISLPFTWALQQRKEYDAFIVITDNETNCNRINPIDAFKQYKKTMKLPETKLIVLATSATDFSIGETNKHCLNVCGFDDNVFTIIQDFISEN
jgi:60 kDa SS-A/Ro ribonucleoprotein